MKFTNKTYDIMKYIAQVGLPAVTALWLTISKIWGIPYSVEIGATASAIDVCLGALLMLSASNYNKTIDKE